MGLDLIVEGCAKVGHEEEWHDLLARSFSDENLSEAELVRFHAISIPGYERVGAPRVGRDSAADEWMWKTRGAKTPEECAAVLKEFDGFYVLRLVECDGVPQYSHGGLYSGADETSFRGSFLKDCKNLLSKEVLNDAWGHKFPEEAVAYGRVLLAASEASATIDDTPKRRRGLLSRLLRSKEPRSVPIAEQRLILRAAGRWYVFWGERGHAIRAWF